VNGFRLAAASLFGCGEETCLFGELSELPIVVLGLTVRVGFRFAACSGAGVVFSSSTIGAGERCAINRIDNRTKKKRKDRITGISRRAGLSGWRQLRRIIFSVRAALVGPASSVFRELQSERLWIPFHFGRFRNKFVSHGAQDRAVPDSRELNHDIAAFRCLCHRARFTIAGERDRQWRASGDCPFVNRS